jgi:hypothetical protein
MIEQPRDWFLRTEDLKVLRIMQLAMNPGITHFPQYELPGPPTDSQWGPRLNNLIEAVRSGRLKSTSHRDGAGMASVNIQALRIYAARRRGDWGWCREFCREWIEAIDGTVAATAKPTLPMPELMTWLRTDLSRVGFADDLWHACQRAHPEYAVPRERFREACQNIQNRGRGRPLKIAG